MQQVATAEHQATPAALKPVKPPRISKALRQAIDLLSSGECKTQKAAAERVGLNDQYLSRALNKVEIRAFCARKAAENISRGVLRASARFVELIDAESEHVAAKVSERFLEHGGIIKPQQGSSVNVSINNNMSAGYVIDLTPHQPLADAQRSPNKGTLTIENAEQSGASTSHPRIGDAGQARGRSDRAGGGS